jgi:hypothetical protein
MSSPELANAALSCAPLARALKLTEWVGQGKTLTSSGVLRPADAAQACRDLGIEFLGPRLRSALDVEELMRDWDTAVIAGFLRMEGRRAWAAEDLPDTSSSAHRHPEAILDAWVQVATFFLDLDEDPCAGCLTVLHALHTAAGPLTMEQLASSAGDLELEGIPCPGCGQVHGQPDSLDLSELFGDQEGISEDATEHAADTVTALMEFAAATLSDEAVRLTELGTFLAESVFEQRAVSPDADAATVVSAITELPLAVAGTIARSWLNARSAAGAVRELLTFAESAIGVERVGAVAFARGLGPDAAEAWREWAKRPGFGAYARDWLRSSGELVTEESSDEAWLAADALCIMVDSLAEEVPPDLFQSIAAQRLGEDIAEVAGIVLRSDHPRASAVLALLSGRPGLAAVSGSAPVGRSESGMLVYQLKITLRGVSKPPVWRRVLVPARITLNDLHGVIQQAMGWDDYHLHVFTAGWREYGSADPELGHASDKNVRLSEVLAGPGDRLRYTYDFGDDWEHDVVVEESLVAEPGQTYPQCVAGKGACPPEDCGGVWRYGWLKEVLADPSHEEHQDMLDWLGLDAGEDFDLKEFSVEDVNSRLRPF